VTQNGTDAWLAIAPLRAAVTRTRCISGRSPSDTLSGSSACRVGSPNVYGLCAQTSNDVRLGQTCLIVVRPLKQRSERMNCSGGVPFAEPRLPNGAVPPAITTLSSLTA
jgi:hypothetical protein